jgi:hypothetical protein
MSAPDSRGRGGWPPHLPQRQRDGLSSGTPLAQIRLKCIAHQAGSFGCTSRALTPSQPLAAVTRERPHDVGRRRAALGSPRSSTRGRPRGLVKDRMVRRIWRRDSRNGSGVGQLRPTQNHAAPSRVKGPEPKRGGMLSERSGRRKGQLAMAMAAVRRDDDTTGVEAECGPLLHLRLGAARWIGKSMDSRFCPDDWSTSSSGYRSDTLLRQRSANAGHPDLAAGLCVRTGLLRHAHLGRLPFVLLGVTLALCVVLAWRRHRQPDCPTDYGHPSIYDDGRNKSYERS